MENIRESKKAVRAQGSQLGKLVWCNATCLRCGHLCAGNHRPGTFGRCTAERCPCQYATVACDCGHDSAEHERFGEEVGINCQLCACPAFANPAVIVP
jgi:hypothetical protein